MSKLTEQEFAAAKSSAERALEADRRHDVVARDQAMRDLFVAAGYWLQRRTLTTAEFRGDAVPPKMIRMPAGRSLRWSAGLWKAAEAWAQA